MDIETNVKILHTDLVIKDGVKTCKFNNDHVWIKKKKKYSYLRKKIGYKEPRDYTTLFYYDVREVEIFPNTEYFRNCECGYKNYLGELKNNALYDTTHSILKHSGIPDKYRLFDYPIENEYFTGLNENIETNFASQLLLNVYGLMGRRKTTFVCMTLKNGAKKHIKVFYITADDLSKTPPGTLINYMRGCKVVAIDEMGARAKQGDSGVVAVNIKWLVENGKSIILIHNATDEQMIETFEWMESGKNGAFRSMLKDFDEIIIKGKDYRGMKYEGGNNGK